MEIRSTSIDLARLATAPAAQGSSSAAGTTAIASALHQVAQPTYTVKQPSVEVVQFVRSVYESVVVPKVSVTLYNVNSKETATFRFTYDGVVDDSQAKHLRSFFRCRRTRRGRTIHQGVLKLLVDVSRRYPGRTIEVVSGYRARPYGVRKSRHFKGAAIDLRVQGVKTHEVRDYVWGNHTDGIGVGWYRGHNFIHIDARPGHNDAAWTSLRRNGRYYRRPKWSRKPRPVEMAPFAADETGHDHDHGDPHASL